MDVKQKTILITGASQGLGRVLAETLAASGARVILLARSERRLQSLKRKIEKSGGEAEYVVSDIQDEQQVGESVVAIVRKFKKIDVLINNAGVWTDQELEGKDIEKRRKAIQTNLLGSINMTEALLPRFQRQNSGVILNVISTAGTIGTPASDNTNWRSYGASKWGMTGYTHALRENLRKTKIKVVQVFPGGFESNLYENAGRPNPHSQPWMMKTEDVADVVIFALTRPDDVYMEQLVFSKQMDR